MSSESESLVYVKPEEQIYSAAINKDLIDWKSFLYELIYTKGLDPWDIDLGLLTKMYISSLKELKKVDFDVSGKFLTIAVFLLKTKTEALLEKDIRGIEMRIASVENQELDMNGLDSLEDFDLGLENLEVQKKREKYQLKYRNPIARKRKVTIFDLIKTLEKTFEQSNRRRSNFLQRKGEGHYEGPMYERKSKDLKQLIEELYQFILKELEGKGGHMNFSSLIVGVNHKIGILERFIPLLHLHNHNKITLAQEKHFGEIRINKYVGEE